MMTCLLIVLVLLAACGPVVSVSPVAVLRNTPGPAVVITDDRIETAVFQIERPDGWRVITSAADAPVSIILVSPDERWLMMISAAPIDVEKAPRPTVDDESELRSERRDVMLDDETFISTFGAAPVDEWDAFDEIFTRTIESLAAV
ncbi:MAG: hypothetical protein D6737_20780 [Chloroflexi bacterium]|nr:MAG: hypothetical protein D6737_20780 [Chloroflexota bacterium]